VLDDRDALPVGGEEVKVGADCVEAAEARGGGVGAVSGDVLDGDGGGGGEVGEEVERGLVCGEGGEEGVGRGAEERVHGFSRPDAISNLKYRNPRDPSVPRLPGSALATPALLDAAAGLRTPRLPPPALRHLHRPLPRRRPACPRAAPRAPRAPQPLRLVRPIRPALAPRNQLDGREQHRRPRHHRPPPAHVHQRHDPEPG